VIRPDPKVVNPTRIADAVTEPRFQLRAKNLAIALATLRSVHTLYMSPSTCRLYYRQRGSHVFCYSLQQRIWLCGLFWLLSCKLLDYVIGHVTIRLE